MLAERLALSDALAEALAERLELTLAEALAERLELTEAEAENVEVEQKTKLQEFSEKVKDKVDSTLEKVDKAIQIAENKKNEILSQLEKIKKDAKIDELMNLVRAGTIAASKVNEMIDYAKNFSETDRRILMNFLRNQIGGR